MSLGPIQDGLHLVGRFLGSVRPGAPSTEDVSWAHQQLIAGERLLWDRMSNPDKRHSVTVARATDQAFADHATLEPTRPIMAAALLHDVGKVVSNFRTPARVVATFVWLVVPTSSAQKWLLKGKPFQRMAQYRLHPELGEQLLCEAEADVLTSNWAGDHHRPSDAWRVPTPVGQILKDCDDD